MSTTDTRVAFEAALRNKGATERELRHAGAPYEGLYANPRVQLRWEGWQAATEAAKATGTAGELPQHGYAGDDFDKGLNAARQGEQEVSAGFDDLPFIGCPEDWTEKPFCRIAYHYDGGDRSAGISPSYGWTLSANQAGTVIADLAARQPAPVKGE